MDPLDIDWTNIDSATHFVRFAGILIPLLTAVLTKKVASSGVKAVMTTTLSILAGTIGYLLADDGGYDFGGFLNGFLNAYVPAVATYYSFWKPTGIAGSFAVATAHVGIGSPPRLETDSKGQE